MGGKCGVYVCTIRKGETPAVCCEGGSLYDKIAYALDSTHVHYFDYLIEGISGMTFLSI